MQNGEVPYCIHPSCRSKKKRRRYGGNDSDSDESNESRGVLKPEITFFGEALPSYFYKALGADVERADLVIVIGTYSNTYFDTLY